MKKPDDIPQDIWTEAVRIIFFGYDDLRLQWLTRVDVARAILAECERCASVADREALDRRNRQAEAATARDEESHLLHALLAQQSDKIAAAIRKGGE